MPKKSLGQHFLKETTIAQNIVDTLSTSGIHHTVIEIGPGTGSLTKLLVKKIKRLYLVEIDADLIPLLKKNYPILQDNILLGDFLKIPIAKLFPHQPITIIGNFPYNISSQIFFKILEYREQVEEVVCMVQQEVAARLTSKPGCKTYGIPSVLLQAFYTIHYCFDVGPQVFMPPPKVNSAVIKMNRNVTFHLSCNESLFFAIVKGGFQQRRKKLKNALSNFKGTSSSLSHPLLNQRAEQLTVQDFVALTQYLMPYYKR